MKPYRFSDKSIKHLASCDPLLQLVAKEVIKQMDFAVICGHRSEDEQNELFKQGLSKKVGGESQHNLYPSKAIDLVPMPLDWENPKPFYLLAGLFIATAFRLGIKIRWGGAWEGKLNDTKNNKFNDLVHFELIE